MGLHHASPYTRPGKGGATERVWQIADDLTRRHGRKARRKDVIDVYVAEGGNANTASTQYYYWSQAEDARRAGTDDRSPAAGVTKSKQAAEPVALQVDGSGRLVIPQELREAMLLGESGRVTARVVNGELRLISPEAALREMQARARKLLPAGGSVVDEFIAEKRAEAESE
jgi:antitoxin PrlF